MRLTEAIAGEAHHHGPNGIDDMDCHATRYRAFIELALIVAELPCLMFLAQDLSELVAILHGEPSQRHGDLHHIFLIDHDPMRFSQHLIEQWMR